MTLHIENFVWVRRRDRGEWEVSVDSTHCLRGFPSMEVVLEHI
jgi:hypothetical protein